MWGEYDKRKKEDDPEFYNENLEELKRIEWDRRLNGFWYMNNGKPIYITGMHYMYLRWWHIDTGLPKFRIPDLEYFYFLQYCLEDPICMGMVEVTKRRFGKSFRAGLFVTEYITRTKISGFIKFKKGDCSVTVVGRVFALIPKGNSVKPLVKELSVGLLTPVPPPPNAPPLPLS